MMPRISRFLPACLLLWTSGLASCQSASQVRFEVAPVLSAASGAGSTLGAVPRAATSVAGMALEARTLSIYAGACHYNGERVLAGHTAVLAWQLQAGLIEGQHFGGADIVAVVTSEANLVDDLARTHCVYLDPALDAAQVSLALRWLDAHAQVALGQRLALVRERVQVRIEAGSYWARVGDRIHVQGAPMPNLECCKMPYNVWYQPLTQIDQDSRRVGCTSSLVCVEPRLKLEFSRQGENDAWFGALSVKQAQVPTGEPR